MNQENLLRTTLTPSGFHRTISVTMPQLTADHDDCTCHIYLALPAATFVDLYELALYHEIFTFEYWGTRDLERPVAAVSQADSLVLISPRDTNNRTREITIDIPIHSRYGDLRLHERPGENVGHQEVRLEHPRGLMRCPIPSTHKSQLEKLDGIPQQIERHFNTSNGFILTSLPATPQSLQSPSSPLVMNIPLGDPSHTLLVEVGTALIILLCFAYVAWGASQCRTRIYGEGGSKGTPVITKKAE